MKCSEHNIELIPSLFLGGGSKPKTVFICPVEKCSFILFNTEEDEEEDIIKDEKL